MRIGDQTKPGEDPDVDQRGIVEIIADSLEDLCGVSDDRGSVCSHGG